jgi:hypothetical protein
MSPFSAPLFWGTQKREAAAPQGERVLYGRDPVVFGRTGKAQTAKLPGAGIGPKPCPGNERQKRLAY